MWRKLVTSAALLLAVPAAAQEMAGESAANDVPVAVLNTPPGAKAVPDTAGAEAMTPAEAADATSSEAAVAETVAHDFAGYDTDANQRLDKAEFGAWMTALRKAAEPDFDGTTPDAQAWIGRAFTAADADRNGAVDRDELTRFLTPRRG